MSAHDTSSGRFMVVRGSACSMPIPRNAGWGACTIRHPIERATPLVFCHYIVGGCTVNQARSLIVLGATFAAIRI